MTFRERYNKENTWHGKVLVMEIYHLAMSSRNNGEWKLSDTASHFDCSIGLVSENLRLAHLIHVNEKIVNKCKTRQDALKFIRNKYD